MVVLENFHLRGMGNSDIAVEVSGNMCINGNSIFGRVFELTYDDI